jgi:ribosomal protein L37AE/L43A
MMVIRGRFGGARHAFGMSERSERIIITARSAHWCIACRPDRIARKAMVHQ